MVTDRTLRRSSKIVVNIFETIYNMSSLFVHIQLLLFELINYRYKLVYEYWWEIRILWIPYLMHRDLNTDRRFELVQIWRQIW